MSMLQRAAEARQQIADLTKLLDRDMLTVWKGVDQSDPIAARDFLLRWWPELVAEYHLAGSALAADLYDEWREVAKVAGSFAAVPVGDVAESALAANVRWSLGSAFGADPDWGAVLTNLSGAANRHVADAHRQTIESAARADPAGTKYARHASASACGFCRMLATRGAVYLSRENAGRVTGENLGGKDYRKLAKIKEAEERAIAAGHGGYGVDWRAEILKGSRKSTIAQGGRKGRDTKQKRGEKYHDHCHCSVVAVFPGDEYEEAPYVTKWRETYLDAYYGDEGGVKAAMKALDSI